MPRVSFYIAPDRPTLRLACQITEKGWQQGYTLYLHVADEPMAAELDRQLWIFRETSFLPHQRLDRPRQAGPMRIFIGYQEPPETLQGVMINLAPTPTPPPFIDRFERLSELVPHDEAGKMAARHRYRIYQERSYPIETHNL